MRRVLAAVLCLACASGCARVKQYQRGAHAQRAMSGEPCPGTSSLESHVISVREGGMTPATGSGSGCGCD